MPTFENGAVVRHKARGGKLVVRRTEPNGDVVCRDGPHSPEVTLSPWELELWTEPRVIRGSATLDARRGTGRRF